MRRVRVGGPVRLWKLELSVKDRAKGVREWCGGCNTVGTREASLREGGKLS